MAAEGHRTLIETYGDVAPSITICEYWLCRFKNSDFNINDKNWKMQICKLLDKNPALSTSELTRELNIDRTIVIKRDMLFK